MVVQARWPRRVPFAVPVLVRLGEMRGVGPGHDRQHPVRQRHRARRRPSPPPAGNARSEDQEHASAVEPEEVPVDSQPGSRRVLGARPSARGALGDHLAVGHVRRRGRRSSPRRAGSTRPARRARSVVRSSCGFMSALVHSKPEIGGRVSSTPPGGLGRPPRTTPAARTRPGSHRPADAAVLPDAPEVDHDQERRRQRDRHAVQHVEPVKVISPTLRPPSRANFASDPEVIRLTPFSFKSEAPGPSTPTPGVARAMFEPTVMAQIASWSQGSR